MMNRLVYINTNYTQGMYSEKLLSLRNRNATMQSVIRRLSSKKSVAMFFLFIFNPRVDCFL